MPGESREWLEVDARGLYCPLPVLRLAGALRRSSHERMRLLATDPGTSEDIETFCRETGHRLDRAARDVDGTFVFEITRKP